MTDTATDVRRIGATVEFVPEYLDAKQAREIGGQPFRVTKVNPRSIDVESESGIKVRADAYMLRPSDKTFTAPSAPIERGTIVRFAATATLRLTGDTRDGFWVVCDVKTDGARIARLGGDRNRAYSKVPTGQLVVVPVTYDPAEEVLRLS